MQAERLWRGTWKCDWFALYTIKKSLLFFALAKKSFVQNSYKYTYVVKTVYRYSLSILYVKREGYVFMCKTLLDTFYLLAGNRDCGQRFAWNV